MTQETDTATPMENAAPTEGQPNNESQAAPIGGQTNDEPQDGKTAAVEVQTPEFVEMNPVEGMASTSNLERLGEIRIGLVAELGRTELPIQQLLQVGPGSVLTLDRNVNSPVEIVAQGVPLARGEVVVVDNSFAIRVLEVYQSLNRQKQEAQPPQ